MQSTQVLERVQVEGVSNTHVKYSTRSDYNITYLNKDAPLF